MVRIAIVDDQRLIRAGFRSLLESEPGLEVVGEAADGAEGLDLVRRQVPDVVLLDIQMPVLDGIETTRRIVADPGLAAVHVVILTNYAFDEYVFDALHARASGFLVKDTEPAELLRAVRVAARGDALLSPGVTRRLVAEFVSRPAPLTRAPRWDVLTEREREVVALVARGLTNTEIAERLFIAQGTAKTHVSRAMVKLGARDRAQLVVFAYETGLVSPGS